MMQRRTVNAPNAPLPASPYSQAVEVTGVTRTLHVSGQIPASPDGTVPTDPEAQMRLAWANVVAQLEAAGYRLDHIVKVVTILPDRAHLPLSRRVREEVMGALRPASTLIVAGLASEAWLVEIDVVACA